MDLIKADAQEIVTNGNDFGTALELTTADGATTVVVNGLATSHHLRIEYDGTPVSGRNVHVSVSEAALVALSFPTRNSANEIKLRNCTVKWTDATGVEATYIIADAHPDNTIGLIVCTLKDKA